MLFRTILYALISYGIFWLIRRLFGGVFGASRNGAAGGTRSRRYGGKAVDADFEEIDEKRSGGKTHDDSERKE